jgi:acyl-CoA reductase-like NAD-dependent aldehyde dehydrogenase
MNAEERLTVAQRACLLRAVRKQLNVLTEELERLIVHNDPDTAIEDKMQEIQCIQGAIRWLWKDSHHNHRP